MRRGIDSSASAVPLAPILLKMSTQAYGEVTEGIRELDLALQAATRRRLRWKLYLQVAVHHLRRTYLTLHAEALKVCQIDPDQLLPAIQTLRRRSLVARVHQGSGDFAVIHRAYRLLGSQGPFSIVERLTNREVHLFALLVPLAAYTDELARDLEHLVLGLAPRAQLEARLYHARRDLEPVLTHLDRSAKALQTIFEALKGVPKEVVRVESDC